MTEISGGKRNRLPRRRLPMGQTCGQSEEIDTSLGSPESETRSPGGPEERANWVDRGEKWWEPLAHTQIRIRLHKWTEGKEKNFVIKRDGRWRSLQHPRRSYQETFLSFTYPAATMRANRFYRLSEQMDFILTSRLYSGAEGIRASPSRLPGPRP